MNGCEQKYLFIRLFSICGYMATQVISACIEIALQATPSEKEARMNEQQSSANAYGNPVYDMIGSSMLVVSEEDAVKFLGRNRLLQLMVDRVDGVGPTFLSLNGDSSRRYYFVGDLLYWNKNRP